MIRGRAATPTALALSIAVACATAPSDTADIQPLAVDPDHGGTELDVEITIEGRAFTPAL